MRYYRDINSPHINTLNPRAYFIPSDSEDFCVFEPEKSPYYIPLNGEWDFFFSENTDELEIEAPGFTKGLSFPYKITVPGCWQLQLPGVTDAPNYINQDYPFPVDPPHLEDVIPCGIYSREFSLSKKTGKRFRLNFEGVASGFYVWINDAFAGWSQVSHCTSEFDITELVTDGVNKITVLVVKHCTGSYMEDQDFFRLNGIFRDVYILERDENCVEDVFIRQSFGEDFSFCRLNAELTFRGSPDMSYKLLSPSGETIANGKACESFCTEIRNPVLWSPENPVLYKLFIYAGEEVILFEQALKKAEIKNSTYLFNGSPVKIRGINRHDTHPEKGYAVSLEDMKNDIRVMKRAHVDTVRTSHYPNAPLFLSLCEHLGIAVVDEADLETHGMGYNYGDWYWDYWAHICDVPEWREQCLDRARRLFERDKNRGCVIMWSLGNESGCGENHRAMAQYIRSRNENAIIHYENAHLIYEQKVNRDFSDISDVESRMYADLDYLNDYLGNDSLKKPFFYCEYVSAWSTGDIPLHWKGFEDHPKYMGGCIWEFADHAVNTGTKESPRYRYGGDFGDYPNDKFYCVDGLVYPDRSPRPGYFEMKETYKPFSLSLEKNILTLKSKKYFSALNGMKLVWTLEEEGITVLSGEYDVCLAPGEKLVTELPLPSGYTKTTVLNARVIYTEDTSFAKAGEEAGHESFMLLDAPVALASGTAEVRAEETRTKITVSSGSATFVFDKITGSLISVKTDRELLNKPCYYTLFRAYLDNASFRGDYERARYIHAKHHAYSTVLETGNNSAKVTVTSSMASPAMPPAVKMTETYTFDGSGTVGFAVSAKVTENAPPLPGFGFVIPLNSRNYGIRYLGYGPEEAYCDRYGAFAFSRYETDVEKNFEPHIVPTEGGAHVKTKYARIEGEENSLEIASPVSEGFVFNVKPYSDEQLFETKHNDELKSDGAVYLRLDYAMTGDNAGPDFCREERVFNKKSFDFSLNFKLGD